MIDDEGSDDVLHATDIPPHPDTFMGHHVAGRDPGDIDDWVERWHESDGALQLHQFLGMTLEEYGNWMLAPQALPSIIAVRRMVEAERLAFQHLAAAETNRIN